MPRKHREPKPRNIEKIKRKREKRKAEKLKLLIESGYADVIQSHVSHQKQAEFVALNEYPNLKIEQSKKETDLWQVLSEEGFVLRTYTLGDILRKFRLYSGRELSKYEMIQEITQYLNFSCTIQETKEIMETLLSISEISK